MNDELRLLTTNSFLSFIGDAGDPSLLESKMPCLIKDLFLTQKNCDKTKKVLKQDFDQAVSSYFLRFKTSDGFDAHSLAKALEEHSKNMVRHLGKDRFDYLILLSSTMKCLSKKKGLLAS